MCEMKMKNVWKPLVFVGENEGACFCALIVFEIDFESIFDDVGVLFGSILGISCGQILKNWFWNRFGIDFWFQDGRFSRLIWVYLGLTWRKGGVFMLFCCFWSPHVPPRGRFWTDFGPSGTDFGPILAPPGPLLDWFWVDFGPILDRFWVDFTWIFGFRR